MNSELTKLLRQIAQMGRSPAKVALLEQAIQLADSLNDIEGAFGLRQQLVETAERTGQPEKMLVAFSWNLAQCDRDPERFDEAGLLWTYKWVIPALCEFPQITREQLEASLADLARRFHSQGASLRPVHTLECKIAEVLGDGETIRTTLPLWKKAKQDWLSDCKACDKDGMVDMYFFLRQDREGLKTAEPILAGKMSCQEVPHLTLPSVLIPLLRRDRLDDAMKYYRQGLALIQGDPNFVAKHAEVMIFQVLIQELPEAAKLFEEHLRFAWESQSPLRRYKFFLASVFLLRRLQQTPTTKAKWHLPADFPLWNEQGIYDLQQLTEWFEEECGRLAQDFDSRAGNNFRTNELQELADLEELIRDRPPSAEDA